MILAFALTMHMPAGPNYTGFLVQYPRCKAVDLKSHSVVPRGILANGKDGIPSGSENYIHCHTMLCECHRA
jgi:hypothetical protein